MKLAVCIVACFTVSVPVAEAGGTSAAVTPVQKVIELMEGMLTKGKAEKHAEQVQFAAYKQFCDDTTTEKKRAIDAADEQIEVLKADIEQYTAQAAQLTKEIAAHSEDIAVWTGDTVAATKVRELERAEYDKLHADYSESVDALGRAIQVLREQAHDREQASSGEQVSLAQLSALQTLRLVPLEAKKAVEAFLSETQQPEATSSGEVGLAVKAPEAYGYEFQSHGVIEVLAKLLDKFVAERTTLEREEMSTQHAYGMLMQDLKAQIRQATQDKGQKSATKAKRLQAKANTEGDLEDTTTTRSADVQYLSELTATCEQKATDFVARQQLRSEELVALNKAIEIISSEAVSGSADRHLPSLAQQAASLAALRADLRSEVQSRAASYLQARARDLNSRVLSMLAGRVADDPFRRVKKMIKDLLTRLMEEANEEAEHKGWCDTELSTNEQTRKEKTEAVETLHAEIDQLEASIAKLTEDIATLTKAVAELDQAMATATKLRQEERAANAQTVQDARDAQAALAQALAVLREFYSRAGEATALLQKQPEAPEIFDSPYRGMQGAKGGVIGVLEVIESDFARLEADTKAAEATAQKEYDVFMTDSRVDKAAKTTDIEHKTAKKQDEVQAQTVRTADLEGTQKELDAALAYFDKLKPSCVDAGVSYDDRIARRKEEIESLQEALRILNGEDTA
eukprot:CAMPEP_0168376850 /NCGR_PEP_ID=MMETSP0228-20121227/10528_1 /TAXON_ID=133427 /ORGANISM="Protoceratium reticulatum, Strain CCCM 535 (=CCMP 1889)" /LENGTH=685 /DNA_ID=CAMNT_0008389839 /DNA_START=55 /DNA_END=2112 /DNA_ORIENTATION=-